MIGEFEQVEQLSISDVETLKVLSDPLRLRLLELMVQQPTTVKRMAEQLDEAPNKLYYHINLLEQHGLIGVVETRVVSGIIEKWYMSTARNFGVDRNLLSLIDDPDSHVSHTVASIFEAARADIVRSIRARLIKADPAGQPKQFYLQRSVAHMTPEQYEHFSVRLQEVIQEFCDCENIPLQPGQQVYGLTLALYPMYRPETSEQEVENGQH